MVRPDGLQIVDEAAQSLKVSTNHSHPVFTFFLPPLNRKLSFSVYYFNVDVHAMLPTWQPKPLCVVCKTYWHSEMNLLEAKIRDRLIVGLADYEVQIF